MIDISICMTLMGAIMTTAENCDYIFGEKVYSNQWEAEISVLSHADWYISFLILSIYLARKPFRANISIFWFYWYTSLGNLLSKYIDFLILLIYLARKLFRANISIFWFYWYILLGNLSKQIYWSFDFNHISRSETFSDRKSVV